jgi:hypothetical protein
MNWQDIVVADNNTHFLLNGTPLFNRYFTEVLKFHSPGLAPVKDESGSYHIKADGTDLYPNRYSRTFGYYFNRASVIENDKWYHIDESGNRIYPQSYSWTGNYQEKICVVRDINQHYYHIDLFGNRLYKENYLYAGDFKDGIACVKLHSGGFIHIDINGKQINDCVFIDLGVFHKNYATAKDILGWHHIDKKGNALYQQRYLIVEPFYNGYALVTDFDETKKVIDEMGLEILTL